MSSPRSNGVTISDDWFVHPPESLVVGDGAYARALALVLGRSRLCLHDLRIGPKPNMENRYPRVFENLKRAFLVVSETMAAADTVQCHTAIWDWIGKLSSIGDQHELSFIFVLPPDTPQDYESALAAGLGLSEIDSATSGHAILRRSGSLEQLLEVTANTQAMDLLSLRARCAADVRAVAVAKLRSAVAGEDFSRVSSAVRDVLSVFSGHEYHLDVFCCPPSHQHGNRLREWLKKGAIGGATSEWLNTGRKELPEWLIERDKNAT